MVNQIPRAISRGVVLLHAVVDQVQYHENRMAIQTYWWHAYRSRLVGVFSYKLAANLAGHGWIGKSALFVTPEHGPRVRWGTVFTDAPLEIGTSMENGCQSCHICVDACPIQAFIGQASSTPHPQEDIFAAQKCSQYLTQWRQTIGVFACGMCIYACPFTFVIASRRRGTYIDVG